MESNSQDDQKIPTNLVSKEERFLRIFFTYIRLGNDKKTQKLSLEKIILKDKKVNNENIEKLKNDWITVYYNIYDYFICKEDYIYTYFFNELIYLSNEENEINTELKNITTSIMKMCLKIQPPRRDDIINYYQFFRLKDLNKKIFSTLMEIFNMIYSYDKTTSFKEYFSLFDEKKFFLFDGNSHIEIKLDKEWIRSGYKENPNYNSSKTYYVFGFSFRYFKKFENSKLAQIRFPSNKYLILAIRNGLLHINIPIKNNVEIHLLENMDYTFVLGFLKDRIQIYINDKCYDTTEPICETAKNIIIGDKFFGVFFKIYSTFTFEPLDYRNGSVLFTHPEKDTGENFHFFLVNYGSVYQSLNYPKKIFYIKRKSYANATFSGRVLLFDPEKSYLRSLKRYGNFGTLSILLMFFIYKPEFYKKEYIKLIFDKIYENCTIPANEKLYSDNCYFVQSCLILCNYPKEIRDLELIDYLAPLIKYSSGYNYYLDILKLCYGYEPFKNKQPFSFLLIEVIIKKILKTYKIEQLNEVYDILYQVLEHYNLIHLHEKKENIAEDIYDLILIYFDNYKSENENIYFNVPNYFWFITLYIFFFELKNKIKEVQVIYNKIKEEFKNNDKPEFDENKYIINLVNFYILLYNKEKINYEYIYDNNNKQREYTFFYISYIFKLYSCYKKDIIYENLVNTIIKEPKIIFDKFKFETLEDYKDKSILYFLIPTVYNLPIITKSFKKEENSLILDLLCEDYCANQKKEDILNNVIKLFKNICINLKFTDTKSNKYLIYFMKRQIFKQIEKIEFKVNNLFYSIFDKDEENAKLLSVDISNLFGNLYSKLSSDKKDNKTDHEISEDRLKEYLDPNDDDYQSDYLVSNTNIEEMISNMKSRKNWIKTTIDEQTCYNQNWTDLDFYYNSENKNPKFVIKGVSTNDLKVPFLFRIPDITKSIRKRNKKGIPDDKLSDLFRDEPQEPFPTCVHLSIKEIKQKLDFILRYHEDLNLEVEKEYLKDNKKKYPCCVLGGVLGKGFFYVKDEKTIEYQNYYELDKAEYYEYIDDLNGISTDKKFFYNPDRVYRITIEKENIKMFFKKINYYSDQGLEIYLFLGGSWNFTFKGNRDEFLEEAGLIKKEGEKEEEKSTIGLDRTSLYDADWRKKYLFKPIYNDINYKSGIFSKPKTKEIIGYISKYFRFPGDNKYWENPCLSDLLKKWKDHEISTYTLLIYLNIFSGRSIEDKTQNLIMPSLMLLNSENKVVLRNLKVPIGQQKLEKNEENSKRIEYFNNLYKNEKDKKNAYFYPTCISTQKSVLKNLSSIIPYNQIAKNIFNDKNNILTSVNKDIIDSLTNINNVTESQSEFFYLSECFTNMNNLKDLNIEGVELPQYNLINNEKYKFDKSVLYTLTLNKILESKEVNDNIGNWIDLIFGVDQHSEKLKNVYRPECYLNDKEQLETYKNNKEIIKKVPVVGFMPLQLIKSAKFNSLVTRKYLPLNFNFTVKETLTISLINLEETELLNFSALDSGKYIFFGETKIWNIDTKDIKTNNSYLDYPKKNCNGVMKELFNPKSFKKIYALSRLFNYSVHGGNCEDILMFYNHRKLDEGYNNSSNNNNIITAVEIIGYVGNEHYLLVGKQNGYIHHYKVDFESIDDLIKYPDDNQYPGYFYKSILKQHNQEIISIKYNPYLNLWVSSSKDGYVHIWNYSGDSILSTHIKSKNIKYAILSSDPIPCFIVYFDNEMDCYLLNQIKPLRKLELKTEVYNFDIIKSNCFEDFLVCQDDEKIYIISIPYMEIVSEINEKVTSFDYLSNEKLIIGFIRNNDENKVIIKKIKCNI